MEIVLVILALMLATFLGWLLRQSFNAQPWVAEAVDDRAHLGPMGAHSKVIGLTVLLAVISSFFALVMSAYSERMQVDDWIPLAEPGLLWVNTGVLALASIAFQWTRNAAIAGQQARLLPGMTLTGVLTVAFVVGQLIAWSQLNAAGEYVYRNPANGFFFFMTGAHAVHILGGLYVWARATARLVGGRGVDAVRQSIELCTVYWHFLLIVWLVMFGLLLST